MNVKNELHTFLRTRRSIRRFKPDPVPLPVLQKIIETATFAPSARNKQPWRFIVVIKSNIKKQLAEAIAAKFKYDMTADGASEVDIQDRVGQTIRRTTEAPLVIVLCQDAIQVDPQPNEIRQQAEDTMAKQSIALAGLQLLLASHAEGLGGTWICWPLFASEAIKKILNLPITYDPQAMFFLGYPNEKPEVPLKKPLNEILRIV